MKNGMRGNSSRRLENTSSIQGACASLAIITTASLLASKPRHDWEKVNESLGSGLENSSLDDVGKMRQVLMPSYYDLPSHLKTCLLSLSKYPEDEKIRKDVLIWSWIAEGFIAEETQAAGASLQEIGESYFNELINRSLIQPADITSIFFQDGEVQGCQVHDVVLDLINHLSAEEGLVTTVLSDGKQAGASKVQQNRKIRRLAIHNGSHAYASSVAKEQLSKVRSLTVFGGANLMPPLSSFLALRLLQLEGCAGLRSNHLKDLGKLRYLTFLRLRRPRITELPESIGDLKYLQTLDIRGARSVVLLPLSFVNLQRLVRLIADKVKLPGGLKLGSMKSLRELVGIYITLEVLIEIINLTELRVLRFGNEKDNVGTTDDILQLVHVHLQKCTKLKELGFGGPGSKTWSLQRLQQVPSCLERLVCDGIFYRGFPACIDSSLSRLTMLSIRLSNEPPIMPHHLRILAELPFLSFLKLDVIGMCDQQKTIFIDSGAFPSLRDLRFYSGRMFLMFEAGAMPELQRLYLKFNARITSTFDFGLEYLPSIRHVYVVFQVEEGRHQAEIAISKALKANHNHPSLDIVNWGRASITED